MWEAEDAELIDDYQDLKASADRAREVAIMFDLEVLDLEARWVDRHGCACRLLGLTCGHGGVR